jgi:hypothetical protein
MLFGISKRISKYGRDLKIQYQNTEISFVKEYVYLGNTVDSHLLMNTNFDCAYKKASGRLRLLQNVIECESCLLVKKCLEQEIHNPIFNEYFTMISYEKGTRNNNCMLRLPCVKLEVAKQSFYFGGAKLYNALPLDLRSVQTLEKFRKGLKELF